VISSGPYFLLLEYHFFINSFSSIFFERFFFFKNFANKGFTNSAHLAIGLPIMLSFPEATSNL